MDDPKPNMLFVIAVEQQRDDLALLATVKNFVAPLFYVTNDPAYFWGWQSEGKARSLGYIRAVPAVANITDIVTPWAGGQAGDAWIVFLPASPAARPSIALQHFLQFVGIQPPHIEYVRSIRRAVSAERRALIRFGEGDEKPVVVPSLDDVYEVTDAFMAWRLKSSAPFAVTANIGETAFWTYAEEV